MSSYIDFTGRVEENLAGVDMYGTYISSAERAKNREIYDNIYSEFNTLLHNDDEFVKDMYFSYLSRGYYVLAEFDWALVENRFTDLSNISTDERLSRLYKEAVSKYRVYKRKILIEKLKARRSIRRLNKGKVR